VNLKKLEVFYLTAKYESCSKAADKLLVTQPAVSMQIRELEKFYRVRLFVREGNRLQLTETGNVLYAYAEKIFAMAAEAEDRLFELGKTKKGTLKIGTTRTYAKYILPPLISIFQKENPHIKVVIEEGSSIHIAESVANMGNELVFVADTTHGKRLLSIPFRKEEIFVVVSNKHRWFDRREEVTIADLKGERIILREEGSATRDIILNLFKKYHFDPNILLEGGSAEFIKEIVKEGKGISFFVLLSIKEEMERGIFKPLRLSSERLFLNVRVCFLEKESLSPYAKNFLRVLKEGVSSSDSEIKRVLRHAEGPSLSIH
jgi:DNA-binding transcriptional LysR family regulator